MAVSGSKSARAEGVWRRAKIDPMRAARRAIEINCLNKADMEVLPGRAMARCLVSGKWPGADRDDPPDRSYTTYRTYQAYESDRWRLKETQSRRRIGR